VSFHLSRIGAQVGRGYIGRKVVCEILGRSGVRVSELCDLLIGQVRIHDPQGARFRIPDAKTETGVREVQMSPDLVEAVIQHIDRLRRAGLPTGPGACLVPNVRGGRISRQRIAKIVREAAEAATAAVEAKGLPPLPHVTPHTLRRTYISIALLANSFDVKWVMAQVGHADSKMTMDVYAQLEQRVDRSHGTNFDALVRKAREQSHGVDLTSETGGFWYRSGSDPQDWHVGAQNEADGAKEKDADLQRLHPMASPGLEPGTPRFSAGGRGL